MVGVPGKYKGCETCRRRRVKCTNERPKCSKCITSGRECEGYEREMMFITGTPENKGRVSSHPKKGSGSSPASSSTSKRRSKSRTPIGKESNRRSSSASFVPTYPLTSAWDDFIGLSSNGAESQVLFTALQTPLKSVIREEDDSGDDARFKVSFVPTTPPELPSLPGCDDFSVQAHCLVSTHFPGEEANGGNFCAFLFEHTFQTQGFPTFNNTNPDPVQSAGPENFKAFPNHHYFVRVYRPLVLSSALLRRQPTFLSEPLWQTVPWELYPKPLFDQLLDLIALLSGTLHHTDQIMTMQPTLPRRHQAQDLLHTCLLLEARFDEWLGLAHSQTGEQPVSYWAGELVTSNGEVAFSHSYSFKDSMTGLMFLYYWMSQIRFRRCVDCLHRVIYEPVVDSYADIWPDLPPSLQIDLTRYQQTRDLAASICRGLESTLGSTVHPNLLLAPMTIALELYRDINLATQDCLPEILWLEAFESRLVDKVENVAAVLQQNRWVEVTRF